VGAIFFLLHPVPHRKHSLLTAHEVLEGLGNTVLEATLGVGSLGSLGGCEELLLGADLGSRVGVLNNSLSEDNVAVRAGGLVDLGLGDDEENVLGAAEGDTLWTVSSGSIALTIRTDSINFLKTKTLKLLARLALGARVDLDGDTGAGGVVKGEVLELGVDGHCLFGERGEGGGERERMEEAEECK
jgi:hypothetical protein